MDLTGGQRTQSLFASTGEPRQQALDSRRATLLSHFHDAGYKAVETPILGPSATFFDFSGEAIRSRLFVTSDAAGRELCLRPEYTIPVCLAYLDTDAGKQADYAYCGPVFRAEEGGPGQFLQAGLESFGRSDAAAADAEILVLALQGAAKAGFADIDVQLGDAGLLQDVVEALQLPPAWQRRLKRALDKGLGIAALDGNVLPAGIDHSGVIAALTGTDQQGARALVEDLLSIAGIASVGGRSAAEIADRFLTQVAAKASPAFGSEQRQVLERYLAIAGHPDDVSHELRTLAAEAGLDLERSLALFDERTNFIAVHDLEVERLIFDASFARNLDYYTGFVFEARHAGTDPATAEVVVGGGRYDRLAQSLGSAQPIPAVGASIWVERLDTPGTATHG